MLYVGPALDVAHDHDSPKTMAALVGRPRRARGIEADGCQGRGSAPSPYRAVIERVSRLTELQTRLTERRQ